MGTAHIASKVVEGAMEIGKGVAVQEGASLLMRLPVFSRLVDEGADFLIRLSRNFGGPALETELVNRLSGKSRSVAEAALRRHRERELKHHTLEADMANNKGKGGGGQQGGQSPASAAKVTAAVMTRIASLQPHHNKKWSDELRRIQKESEIIYEELLQIISNISPKDFPTLATDFCKYADGGAGCDLVSYFGIGKLDPKRDEEKKGKPAPGMMEGRLLDGLTDDEKKSILEVMMDVGHDSDSDEQNYRRTMAGLYGDGTDEVLNRSRQILKLVAGYPIQQRRNYFGVRPNPITQVKEFGKRLLGLSDSATKVTAEMVLDASRRADEAEERLRKYRADKERARKRRNAPQRRARR
ncbi:MAG: hypothetical protein ACOYUK_04500 [Patescibacteria group bacterium]